MKKNAQQRRNSEKTKATAEPQTKRVKLMSQSKTKSKSLKDVDLFDEVFAFR
jgi:hypothetical protein